MSGGQSHSGEDVARKPSLSPQAWVQTAIALGTTESVLKSSRRQVPPSRVCRAQTRLQREEWLVSVIPPSLLILYACNDHTCRLQKRAYEPAHSSTLPHTEQPRHRHPPRSRRSDTTHKLSSHVMAHTTETQVQTPEFRLGAVLLSRHLPALGDKTFPFQGFQVNLSIIQFLSTRKKEQPLRTTLPATERRLTWL